MENNYLLVDGSALLNDIKKYRDSHSALKNKKFNPVKFSENIFRSHNLARFHAGAYRRSVFYFVKEDERIDEYIEMPDFTKPDLIEDLEIKYCGKKIPVYKRAAKWLDEAGAPSYVLESLHKSEKAVDTQICCDAFLLLSLNKLRRLFLYTNDYDFIPLCRAIKTMGENINLIRLSEKKVNEKLAKECDGFHAFNDKEIYEFFREKLDSQQNSL